MATHLKRVPRQERSQIRFEQVIEVALRLFGERGYEAVSMREIAREAQTPIASVYQYFPTKQAIVKEIWLRYSQMVRAQLEQDLQFFIEGGNEDGGDVLIDRMVDLIMMLQTSSPAYVEVWGCIAATPELRILNDQDTLAIVATLADALQAIRPAMDRDSAEGLALMLSEAASSITKLTLALPAEQQARIVRQLKASMKLLYRATLNEYARPVSAAVP